MDRQEAIISNKTFHQAQELAAEKQKANTNKNAYNTIETSTIAKADTEKLITDDSVIGNGLNVSLSDLLNTSSEEDSSDIKVAGVVDPCGDQTLEGTVETPLTSTQISHNAPATFKKTSVADLSKIEEAAKAGDPRSVISQTLERRENKSKAPCEDEQKHSNLENKDANKAEDENGTTKGARLIYTKKDDNSSMTKQTSKKIVGKLKGKMEQWRRDEERKGGENLQ